MRQAYIERADGPAGTGVQTFYTRRVEVGKLLVLYDLTLWWFPTNVGDYAYMWIDLEGVRYYIASDVNYTTTSMCSAKGPIFVPGHARLGIYRNYAATPTIEEWGLNGVVEDLESWRKRSGEYLT